MKSFLIVDCYLDDPDGATSFGKRLNGRPWRSVRASDGEIPDVLPDVAGLIITGSAASVAEPESWQSGLFDLIHQAKSVGLPTLGVCFGHQAIAGALGGTVLKAAQAEVGWVDIEILRDDPIFDGISNPFQCFVSHADEVSSLGPNMVVLARTAQCAVHALRCVDGPMWGLQFHPEMARAEAEKLCHWRAEKHPELNLNPDEMIAAAKPYEELTQAIFGNFLVAADSCLSN